MCPFGAITLEERPDDAPRPAEVKDDGKLAVIDPEACHACGICAANCPEMAIAHNLDDEDLFGRLAVMTEGVDQPVVGFYCRECAGAAISLSGLRRDPYPENVRLDRAAVPGPRQRPAHRRGGPAGRRRRVPRRLRRRPLPVPQRRRLGARADAARRGAARGRGDAACRSSSGTSAPSTATASGAASGSSTRATPRDPDGVARRATGAPPSRPAREVTAVARPTV